MAEENDKMQQQRDIQELRELLSLTPIDICVRAAWNYAERTHRHNRENPDKPPSDPNLKWNIRRLGQLEQAQVCMLLAQMSIELLKALDNQQFDALMGIYKGSWGAIKDVTGTDDKDIHKRSMEEDSIAHIFTYIQVLISAITD